MGRRKTGLTAATVLFAGVLISCGGTEPESVPASPTVAAAAESPTATAQAPTATAEAAAPTVPPAESTTVGARIEGFSHSDLTIPVGTMVTWTNHDPTTHTTTSGTPDNVTELWNSGRLGGGRIFLVHLRPAGDLHLYLHHTPLHAGDDHRYRRRAIRSGANRDAGTDRTHLNAHTHPDPVAISDSYLRASHSQACAANCHRNSSAAYGHPSVPHRHAGAVIGHRNSSATYGHSSASHSHAGAANGHRNSSTAYGHTHATTAHIHSGAGGAGGRAPYPELQPSRPDGESRYPDNLDEQRPRFSHDHRRIWQVG